MNNLDIKKIRTSLKLNQQEFADLVGISKSAVQKWESGERNPNDVQLEKLKEISQKHTLTDDISVNSPYEMTALENNNSNQFLKLENGQYLMTMPLAEFNIQAGLLDSYQDIDFLKGLDKHSIIVDKPVKGRYMAFRVKGDSMDDGSSNAIVQDSIVTTRELQKSLWKDKLRTKDFPFWVIYTTQSRYPLLKEIIEHDTTIGIIKCHSLNDGPEYTDFELSLNEVQALFYVVDVHRTVSRKLTY